MDKREEVEHWVNQGYTKRFIVGELEMWTHTGGLDGGCGAIVDGAALAHTKTFT